jgi:acetylornithine deacetylase/succinyl-diaminopimelate desuccinylase-like protein
MDTQKTQSFVNQMWDDSIIPELSEYIKVPNKSPMFDPDWEKHGHMDKAVAMFERWCREQPIEGMQVEVVRLEGRTPVLFLEIPGQSDDVVLLYGHYDKQPEFSGWNDDLHPWKPVIKDGKLYGRGGADDGYAVFGSLTAIRALQEQGIPHARCIVLIEGCEESGSFDLPYYIDKMEDRIGEPGLVVCLDAECGNYDQFWCTTSLRGNLTGTLTAEVLTEGVHSGGAGGIVPSSFRILRQALGKIEDVSTGRILIDRLHVDVPEQRRQQAELAAEVLQDSVHLKYPWVVSDPSPSESPYELLLNNTWRPNLTVTGAEGLPELVNAGNVMLPGTTLKLSFRLPPTCDAHVAADAVKEALEAGAPPLAKIEFSADSAMEGWNAPEIAPWLEASMQKASESFFGRPSMYMGTGGTIPFMGMLGEKFPEAQFLVTGLLGPNSNAHGPNEFLHIETGKRLTSCVAQVLEDHFNRA